LFEIGEVVSVFYMDKMITVEKTDEADWDEILPALAVPIRAAESVANGQQWKWKRRGRGSRRRDRRGAQRRPEIAQINELLDERIRPYLASDGGWLEILISKTKTIENSLSRRVRKLSFEFDRNFDGD
jgi:hypothetical protein